MSADKDPGLRAGPCPVSRLATVGGVWAAAFALSLWDSHEKGVAPANAEKHAFKDADHAVAVFERGKAGGL
jgi:hypothetical protein